MSGALAQKIPFESKRVPLERRITLKFQHRDGFVNEYAANISLKGMFITAWVPEPQGSVFLFEVQVADRQRLIHGVGEVVWVREAEESSDRPSGMGIRFLKLDEASREVIGEMVEKHLERGGTPFDPNIPPEGAVAVEELFAREEAQVARSEEAPVAEEAPVTVAEEAPAAAEEAPAAAEEVPADEPQLATVVLDPRLRPFEGRAMASRARRGQLVLWLALAALLCGSMLLVLLT